MDREALYQRALDTWGLSAQMRMLQEECGELIAAVNRRARNRNSPDDVLEELADVIIMCEQVAHFFGVEEVEAFKTRKLERLKARLEKERGTP